MANFDFNFSQNDYDVIAEITDANFVTTDTYVRLSVHQDDASNPADYVFYSTLSTSTVNVQIPQSSVSDITTLPLTKDSSDFKFI